MRAMVLRQPAGIDRLELAYSPEIGSPGPGQIAVRLYASSLNYHDYAVVIGMLKTEDRRIPLSDGAGEVIAVGEDVTEFRRGDAVVSTFFPRWLDGVPSETGFMGVPGDGIDGYAREAVIAPTTAFTHAPSGYSHAEAATLTCAALTAWRALVPQGQLKAGDIVLTQGTGGVSIFALQFAKAMGAKVISTSSSDAKLQRLRDLGADHVINYRSIPEWGRAAREFSDGGVDHVVEVGGPGTLAQSIAATKTGGHIALIGVLTGIEGAVPTATLMRKQIRLQGLTVGTRRQQMDMVRAIAVGNLRPVSDRHFPLENIADAFRYQESGAHVGKVVVEM